jgi:hypothetical protein
MEVHPVPRHLTTTLLLGLLMDVGLARADWSALPPLSLPRFGLAAAGIADRLFVVGGAATVALPQNTVWSSGTQSWSEAAPMSVPRMFHGAVALDGQVYAVGGFDIDGFPTATVERFDAEAQSWSSLAAMPLARGNPAVGTVNGRVLIAGGQGDAFTAMAECFAYDPSSRLWTPIASLPSPRFGPASAVLGGELWVIGGSNGDPVATVERYDPSADGWSAGPDLPEGLWLAGAAALGDRIWVVGGFDASFVRSPRVYSVGADHVWRAETALPEPLAAMSVAALGNCLVVAGGVDETGLGSSDVYAWCESAPPPPPHADTLRVAVRLKPSTLNPNSHRRRVRAHISAEGWSAHAIDVTTIRLAGAMVDAAAPVRLRDRHGRPVLVVGFDRGAFAALPEGEHRLPLVASRNDGKPVAGVAELQICRGHRCRDDCEKDDQDVHDIADGDPDSPGGKRNGRRALEPASFGTGATGVLLTLDAPETVTLEVIDLQGRVVERLTNGLVGAGQHTWQWPSAGRRVAAGLYLVRLRRSGGQEVVRLSVVR